MINSTKGNIAGGLKLNHALSAFTAKNAEMTRNYKKVAIGALNGALSCQSAPQSQRASVTHWMGKPNMKGILSEIAES